MLVRHLRKLLLSNSEAFQEKCTEHLIKHLIPKAYYAFNGVIAQGQFVTLGFALVGSLSGVHYLVRDAYKSRAVSLPAMQSLVAPEIDQDLGEEVVFTGQAKNVVKASSKADVFEGTLKRKSQEGSADKMRKKKKNKKMSAINDIFG